MPDSFRREVLSKLSLTRELHPHPGLWLDKFLLDSEPGSKQRLIDDVVALPIPHGYEQAFDIRRTALVEAGALIVDATVQGRMAVGLGARGSLEAGLRLEHTWGVPIIPGSALKGLAAATANLLVDNHDQWEKPKGWPATARGKAEPTSFQYLFGTTDDHGHVIFHDAWWNPEGKSLPIHLDVMTVHHPNYYQTGSSSPSDFDSPNPIPFASVSGKFLIALEGEEEEWVEAAFELLKLGLKELGIGAKTATGYGRLTLGRAQKKAPASPEAEMRVTGPEETWASGELRIAEQAQGRLEAVSEGRVAIAAAHQVEGLIESLSSTKQKQLRRGEAVRGVEVIVQPTTSGYQIIRLMKKAS